jgi:membrane associated rhomboid family serine protease
MFLHGSWLHLIGNMWYLWIFGNNIEEAMGHFRYLVFYIVCGFLASITHIISNANSIIPTIGASGAIAGVLGGYILLYPRARVMTLIFLGFFIRLLYIPAGFVLGFWFLLQLLSGSTAGRQDAGGVAFWAHVGGFVAGALLVGLFKKRNVPFLNPPRHRAWMYYD